MNDTYTGKLVTKWLLHVLFCYVGTGKMLMEHETLKLKEQEETYTRELREWKGQLKPRKQVSLYSLFQILYTMIHIVCNALILYLQIVS